jgi:hypothetical protein
MKYVRWSVWTLSIPKEDEMHDKLICWEVLTSEVYRRLRSSAKGRSFWTFGFGGRTFWPNLRPSATKSHTSERIKNLILREINLAIFAFMWTAFDAKDWASKFPKNLFCICKIINPFEVFWTLVYTCSAFTDSLIYIFRFHIIKLY